MDPDLDITLKFGKAKLKNFQLQAIAKFERLLFKRIQLLYDAEKTQTLKIIICFIILCKTQKK